MINLNKSYIGATMSYYYTLTNVKTNAGNTSILTILDYIIKNPECTRADYCKIKNLENNHIGNSAWTKLVNVGFVEMKKVNYRTFTYKATDSGIRFFKIKTENKHSKE